MMQPSEKKPMNKIWTYVVLLVCYLVLIISTFGITRSFNDWIIISSVTALIFILGQVVSELIVKKDISFLYASLFTPVFAYAYTYFVNLFLIFPIRYTIIYGSCLGSFIGILLVNKNKVKLNKYGVVGIFLYYILIGYILFKLS